MKTHLIALILITSPAVVAMAAKADQADPKKPVVEAGADKPAATASDEKPAAKKPVLDKGMAAEVVLKFYGKPVEIEPIESPDAATKAERWIYRRKLEEFPTQVAVPGPDQVSYVTRTNADGTVTTTSLVTPTSDYRTKIITVYQVTALLMINGKLELAKQWKEKDESW